MSVWLNENRVLVGLALQLLCIVFAAGMLWQRMRALEKAVLNGLTTRINKNEDNIEELKIARASNETRCAGRKEWIDGLEQDLKELSRQG